MGVISRFGLLVSLATASLAAAPRAAAADAATRAIPAAPAARTVVAVVPGLAVGVDATRVDALGQDLALALAAELDVEALGGLEVRRRLPIEGLPPDCVARAECIADVARRLEATQLLFIVAVDTGAGAVQLDSTWIEPASGRSATRPAIDLAAGTDPRTRFAAAARALLPEAPVQQAPAPRVGTMTPAVPRHYTLAAKLTTGLAIAGAGVGIGFGLRARSRYRDCDVEPLAPIGCDEEHDAIRRDALIADLGYAVAIGGAVATIVLIATSGKESRLVVEPSASGVAVSARGRF